MLTGVIMTSKVFFGVFCCLIMETTIFVSTENADSTKCTVQFTVEIYRIYKRLTDSCQIKTVLTGNPGEKGEKGMPGPKGFRGYVGQNGLPGRDTLYYRSCPEPFNTDDTTEVMDSGVEEKPSDVPCNVIRNSDNRFSGITWVNPSDKFRVNCTGTGLTSLITNARLNNLTYIEEIAFHSPSTQVLPFWISNYYSNATNTQRFNLTQFYKMITPKQIAWLQRNTKQATQTIRIHCKNFHVLEREETALHLFSSNDVVIGPFSSDNGPLSYTIPEGYTNDCKKGAPETEWRYTDIVVRGDTNRLPIIDFYIQDTRPEEQSFFFELLELYFN